MAIHRIRTIWQLDNELRDYSTEWPRGDRENGGLRRQLLGLAVRGIRSGFDEEHELKAWVEEQYRARHDAAQASIDPATIMLILKIVMLLLQWWIQNQAERTEILAQVDGT